MVFLFKFCFDVYKFEVRFVVLVLDLVAFRGKKTERS